MFKNCVVCGKEFWTTRACKKYCSASCHTKAYRTRKKVLIKRICAFCGKEFESDDRRTKCCSKVCARKYNDLHRAPRVFLGTCPTCGKTFVSRYKFQKFCSIFCQRERARKLSRQSYNDKHPLKEKTCPVCGKFFYTRSPIKIYCSSSCKDKVSGRNLRADPVRYAAYKEKQKEYYKKHYRKTNEKYLAAKRTADLIQREKEKPRDWLKEAEQCGMSYGKYRAAVEVFGKTFEELKQAYENNPTER